MKPAREIRVRSRYYQYSDAHHIYCVTGIVNGVVSYVREWNDTRHMMPIEDFRRIIGWNVTDNEEEMW